MKKKVIIPLICLALLAGGLLYSLPYVRIYQIFSALQGGDGERLARYIDFTQLRQSIGEQARAAASAPNRAAGLDQIKQAMAMKMMEYAVDQVVTPAGLTAFFMRNLPGFMGEADKLKDPKAQAPAYGTLKVFATFLGLARCTYTSPAEFAVLFKDGSNQPIRIILNRTGLDWRLNRIVLSRSVLGTPE